MNPKTEGQAVAGAEADARASPEPVKLGKLNMVRLTREELAARQQADREEEARRQEARRGSSGGAGPTAAPPPSPSPSAPSEQARPTAPSPTPPPTNPEGLTQPMPPPAGNQVQGPVLAQLLETALALIGTEGKHLAGLCALGSKVARRLDVRGDALELVPVALQALYVASQLDRRGPYAPPELATLQRLLGPSWPTLAPLIEPSAKGGLSRAKVTRADAAAVAATIAFFTHTRNPGVPAKAQRAAIVTLKAHGRIPAAALEALAAALGS